MAFDLKTARPVKSRFDVNSAKPVNPGLSTGKLKSGSMGFAQGAAFGFGDEGAGLIAGVGKDLISGNIPTVDSYRRARDTFRGEFKDASEANPATYLAGELGGAAATALVPGMQGTSLTKLAVMGGIQGLGNSEADLLEGDLVGAGRDTAIGAVTGYGLGKYAPGAVKAVGRGVSLIPKVGKKVLGAVLGPTEEAIDTYVKNPSKIKNAIPFEDMARELPEAVNKLQDYISTKSTDALKTLSKSKYLSDNAIPKDELMGIIKTAKKELGMGVSNSTVRAKKILSSYAERLAKLKNTVSESQLGDIMRDIRNDINWNDPTASPMNDALKTIQGKLDSILKTGNKHYEAAMKPLAEDVRIFEKARQIFNLQDVPGKGLVPSNATANSIKASANDAKIVSQEVLERLKQLTGKDYMGEVTNTNMAAQFKGGRTNGSRNVNTMSMIGGGLGAGAGALVGEPVTGGTVGGMIGAGAGSYIDKKGGELAAGFLDKYIATKQATDKIGSAVAARIPNILKTSPQKLGKYAPLLKRAATLGAQQVALQHWLLMESDSDYRDLVSSVAEK